jgi:CRP/FNR family cyclic AMP-dependent transcriptional regulator
VFSFLKKPRILPPRLQRLKQSPLFSTLSARELHIVEGLLYERSYLTDEIIFDEGEEGQALYLILSGLVLISRPRTPYTDVLATLGPGTVFGDLALLDDSPRSAQARAVDDCEIAVFFRADFLQLLDTDAAIGYKVSLELARLIGGRLRLWMAGKPQIEAL